MAKITIKNRTQGDLTISAMVGALLISETVPGARATELAPGVLIDGVAEVDEDLIQAAMASPVVQSYFGEGKLVADNPPKAVAKADKK